MKYFANFNANNGTRLMHDRLSNNKRKLEKSIRESAEAHRYQGNECSWSVYECKTGKCIAAGGMTRYGTRYRHHDLSYFDMCPWP